jgi:hypothetical protein
MALLRHTGCFPETWAVSRRNKYLLGALTVSFWTHWLFFGRTNCFVGALAVFQAHCLLSGKWPVFWAH